MGPIEDIEKVIIVRRHQTLTYFAHQVTATIHNTEPAGVSAGAGPRQQYVEIILRPPGHTEAQDGEAAPGADEG